MEQLKAITAPSSEELEIAVNKWMKLNGYKSTVMDASIKTITAFEGSGGYWIYTAFITYDDLNRNRWHNL